MLSSIKSPKDLKQLSIPELEQLCEEIRGVLIDTVAKNGGHLASNLGVVELTAAMHYVLNCPEDQIIWDVGHQSYTHKLLTGRYEKFPTIRKEGGLAGFPKRSESDCDAFNVGHSSTSISAAAGLVCGKQFSGAPGTVAAVIGDGALTGGLAYEGLNNAARLKRNFIVVLNDNTMSISRNVGAVARHLGFIRTKRSYIRTKIKTERLLMRIPLIGVPLRNLIFNSKTLLKKVLYSGNATNNIFSAMGFAYYGPIDGHNLKEMISVFNTVKGLDHPVFLHVVTKKGKGYCFAERNPREFHGISSFDVDTGEPLSSGDSYSDLFGRTLSEMAKKDKRICAITAAMKLGTGLNYFYSEHKERFFDVGIAEEHAVTFASGLAANGMLPAFAVYSSFLQRGYDQIIHDAAAQNLKVVLCIDRAGIVGEDGETHQGLFDAAMLNPIPNINIYCPTYADEMKPALERAFYGCEGTAAVRYHRGVPPSMPANFKANFNDFEFYGSPESDTLIASYSRTFGYAAEAGCDARLLKLNCIKPIRKECVQACISYKKIYFFEEGIRAGGIGEHFHALLRDAGFAGEFHLTAVDDTFVQHATVASSLKKYGLDADGVYRTVCGGERGGNIG